MSFVNLNSYMEVYLRIKTFSGESSFVCGECTKKSHIQPSNYFVITKLNIDAISKIDYFSKVANIKCADCNLHMSQIYTNHSNFGVYSDTEKDVDVCKECYSADKHLSLNSEIKLKQLTESGQRIPHLPHTTWDNLFFGAKLYARENDIDHLINNSKGIVCDCCNRSFRDIFNTLP